VSSALRSDVLAPLRARRDHTAVLFDIDGTLAPIVEHAADARVPAGTRQQLAELARRYAVVACVSGRRAAEARAMVSVGTITYIGSHGAELLRSGWTEAQLDPGLQEWTGRIRSFARDTDTPALRRCRVRIEDKGAIVAFHWRGAPDEAAARAMVETIAATAESAALQTHWGRKVLEVRPPVRIDKGAGIVKLLAEEDIACGLYAGDDVTDLDAFRALREMTERGDLEQAVLVGVASDDGPAEIRDQADIVVQGTDGVRELLAVLIG
jgi:trehalose 6-phosphate phosphatase